MFTQINHIFVFKNNFNMATKKQHTEIRVMFKHYLLIIFLLINFQSFAQNKLTAEGLKIGYWKDNYYVDGLKFYSIGVYKVVKMSDYDTVCYLKDYELLFYKKSGIATTHYVGDLFAVKDSTWQNFDPQGRRRSLVHFSNGIVKDYCLFDSIGNAIEKQVYGYENDKFSTFTYKNNQFFKESVYLSNIKKEAEFFYPDKNLIISNAEFSFISTQVDSLETTKTVELSCKKDLKIKSIKSSSKNVIVKVVNNKTPIYLKKGDSVTLELKYSQKSTIPKKVIAINIDTDEVNVPIYKIFCTIFR
jgi:hypothetical protein